EGMDPALQLRVAQLEKRKFAATARPHKTHSRPSKNPRHIPAHVKRAVRERDGDRCTFVSDSGQRCPARERLEWDHVQPVARGGGSTAPNPRLPSRARNLLEARPAFRGRFLPEEPGARPPCPAR